MWQQPKEGEISRGDVKAYTISVGIAQRKKCFGARGHGSEDSIKMNHSGILGCVVVNWIALAYEYGPVEGSC